MVVLSIIVEIPRSSRSPSRARRRRSLWVRTNPDGAMCGDTPAWPGRTGPRPHGHLAMSAAAGLVAGPLFGLSGRCASRRRCQRTGRDGEVRPPPAIAKGERRRRRAEEADNPSHECERRAARIGRIRTRAEIRVAVFFMHLYERVGHPYRREIAVDRGARNLRHADVPRCPRDIDVQRDVAQEGQGWQITNKEHPWGDRA